MSIELIELPPDVPVIDEQVPDRDKTFVYEHLRHYCALFEPLPAIGIRVEPGRAVVVRGHKYLRIARDLGREAIRASIHPSSDPSAVTGLLARPDVTKLDWAAIDAEERANPVVDQWHVLFFERPLTPAEQQRFEHEVAGFLNKTGDEVRQLEFADTHAQFLARVNVGDESWYGPYIATIRLFSEQAVRVLSFQGRRFQ